MKKAFAGFVSVFLWAFAAAALSAAPSQTNIDKVMEALGQAPEHYEIFGTVCEQVAKLQLEAQFPAPRFKVLTGIAYASGGSTLGELDVVVFEATTWEAVIIAEVKCWRQLSGAINKARDQRQRFINTVKRGRPMQLACTNGGCEFNRANFDSVQSFISIAQQGARSFGFDQELPYSLEQFIQMRKQLMSCQGSGRCARPRR